MAVCRFEPNGDMYGLGIRLGYYFQWFGAIFAAWMAPSEVKHVRFTIDLFVAATFLALVIATANHVESLEPVEKYIVLLLMFGSYLALVPIYLWRLFTRCNPHWDPTRHPIANPGALSANLSFVLLIGVLVYQFWFWFARVPALDRYNCRQYGFLFGQVQLNSRVSVALNALTYFWLALVCLYIFALKVRHILGFPESSGLPKPNMSRRHRLAHIQLLRNMDGWFRIIVALMVIVAVEFTISWNEIQGVNLLSGAAQTIPFVIGIGAIVRVVYIYVFPEPDDNGDMDSEFDDLGPHRGPGGGSRPAPSRQTPSRHSMYVRHRPGTAASRSSRPGPVRQMPQMDSRPPSISRTSPSQG